MVQFLSFRSAAKWIFVTLITLLSVASYSVFRVQI